MGIITVLFSLNRDIVLGNHFPVIAGEIIDVILLSLILGFVFMMFIEKGVRNEKYDPLKQHKLGSNFNWKAFWIATIAVAPAIVFHELGHKIVGLAMGFNATFYAAYGFLILALILRFAKLPFFFFVPGYVALQGTRFAAEGRITSLIALAGPLVNLLLFGIAFLLIKKPAWSKKIFGKYHKDAVPILHLTKTVNIFLFGINMLPIPGFDGGNFFFTLFG